MEIIEALGIRFPLVIAHIVAFLAVMAVFKLFLFDPVRAQLRERDREMAEQRRAALAAEAELEGKRKELAKRLEQIEREAYERTQALVREGARKRNEALAKAREKAFATIGKAREEAAALHAEALERLEDEVTELGQDVLSYVLPAQVDVAALEPALREAVEQVRREKEAA